MSTNIDDYGTILHLWYIATFISFTNFK